MTAKSGTIASMKSSPTRVSGFAVGWVLFACAPSETGDDELGEADTTSDGDTTGDGDGDCPTWCPTPGTSWQWQLTGTLDTDLDVAMFDLDLFDTPIATITTLHDAGRIVVCYFSAGSHEDWRPDAAEFPAEAIGDPLDGWPGERWLDIRDPSVRMSMQARLDLAVEHGCDGVEPDNVDGWTNATGFPLTAADQLDYNRFLAAEAHARGLSVGLKNDLEQIPELVDDFDWALDEECVSYDECDLLAPFLTAGKAVFHVEYVDDPSEGPALAEQVCPAVPDGFSTLVKVWDLDAWRIACP
jgi:endo-alpha-1,4-polygalactosaminidase (GH114 family)